MEQGGGGRVPVPGGGPLAHRRQGGAPRGQRAAEQGPNNLRCQRNYVSMNAGTNLSNKDLH